MAQKELRSVSIVPGQKQGIELKNLPEGRATHIVLELEATISNTSGGALSPTPSQVIAFVSEMLLESPLFHLRSDGRALAALYHDMRGKAVDPDTGVSIANAASGTVTAYIYVPMADPRCDDPNYGAQDTRLLKDKNLDIRFGAALLQTGLTVTGGNVYATIHTTESAGLALPAEVKIDYEDWNQKTANLPEGSYANLIGLHQTAGTALTPTLVDRVRLQDGKGETIIDSIRFNQLVQDFNDKFGEGNSATSEYLSPASSAFLPILTAPDKYKLTQLPHSEGSIRADITGSATGLRFVYRMVVPTERSTENSAWKKMGIVNPERMATEAKTLSKTPLVGNAKRVERLTKILPKRPSDVRARG